MAKKLNKSQVVIEKLNSEGKVHTIDKANFVSLNKEMEAIRRDFQKKERDSQVEARTLVLNA